MMLTFQKKCGRPGGGDLKIRTHEDKGEGVKKWAQICGCPLWMAPTLLFIILEINNSIPSSFGIHADVVLF